MKLPPFKMGPMPWPSRSLDRHYYASLAICIGKFTEDGLDIIPSIIAEITTILHRRLQSRHHFLAILHVTPEPACQT